MRRQHGYPSTVLRVLMSPLDCLDLERTDSVPDGGHGGWIRVLTS